MNYEVVMEKFLFFLAVLSLLAAGVVGYGSRFSGPYQPSLSGGPPAFYDFDPALRDWYTSRIGLPGRD